VTWYGNDDIGGAAVTARRYNPTPDEIAALVAAGWRYTERTADEDAWFWPQDQHGPGYSYKEAVREQRRRERLAQEATA
jgi:hypothetical protein